jgi:hypothetical protein
LRSEERDVKQDSLHNRESREETFKSNWILKFGGKLFYKIYYFRTEFWPRGSELRIPPPRKKLFQFRKSIPRTEAGQSSNARREHKLKVYSPFADKTGGMRVEES